MEISCNACMYDEDQGKNSNRILNCLTAKLCYAFIKKKCLHTQVNVQSIIHTPVLLFCCWYNGHITIHTHTHTHTHTHCAATWHLDKSRNARQEYLKERIDGAVFFDIDEICDKSSPFSHMLPSPEQFSQQVGQVWFRSVQFAMVEIFKGINERSFVQRDFCKDMHFIVAGCLRHCALNNNNILSKYTVLLPFMEAGCVTFTMYWPYWYPRNVAGVYHVLFIWFGTILLHGMHDYHSVYYVA